MKPVVAHPASTRASRRSVVWCSRQHDRRMSRTLGNDDDRVKLHPVTHGHHLDPLDVIGFRLCNVRTFDLGTAQVSGRSFPIGFCWAIEAIAHNTRLKPDTAKRQCNVIGIPKPFRKMLRRGCGPDYKTTAILRLGRLYRQARQEASADPVSSWNDDLLAYAGVDVPRHLAPSVI